MQAWLAFYTVTAGAAATLLGLLFVAVSINAAVILGDAHQNSKRLAEQAFQNYLAVLLVSLLAIFPALDTSELGFTTLAVTALWSIWVLIRFYRTLTRSYKTGARLYSLRRQFSSVIGFAFLVFAAFRMAFDVGGSRNLFAIGTIILLFSATAVSWGLLLGLAAANKSRNAQTSN